MGREYWENSQNNTSGDDDGYTAPETTDTNGNVLKDGDSVHLIKDLKVKGSSLNLKVGTKINNIKLIGDPENIECKQGKSTIVLKTCFLRKA
ncbi:MAG: alkylphosphonate utilization protein [Candidatus Peregrinibacteria bacterium]|nr:alkylphosphonate utilization protein [Candidatus Peregrinibacteria bacterium]